MARYLARYKLLFHITIPSIYGIPFSTTRCDKEETIEHYFSADTRTEARIAAQDHEEVIRFARKGLAELTCEIFRKIYE